MCDLSLSKLPKATVEPDGAAPDGGRPPLAEGWGIGDGECRGSVTPRLAPGIGIVAEGGWGVLCEADGES